MKNAKLEARLNEIESKTPFQCDKDMITAVETILEEERNKPESTQDFDLVAECCERLVMLRGYDLVELEKRADGNREKVLENARKAALVEEVSRAKPPVLSLKRKLSFVLASMVLVIALAGTAIVGFGFEPLKHIKVLLNPFSNADYVDSETYSRGDKVAYFNSIQELCANMDLTILFPSYLPDDIELSKVEVNRESLSDSQIIFEFSVDTLTCNAYDYELNDFAVINSLSEAYISDAISYYIFDEGEEYSAYFEYHNIQYILKYHNYEELVKIINSIKEHN